MDRPEVEQTHVDLMQSLARGLQDLPIVLKGWTALLLCYGLDRFSEDLDFDSSKKLTLTGRVQATLKQKTESFSIKIAKNTETVQRLKIHYVRGSVERLLKLEVSFRDEVRIEDTVVIDGILTYKVARLIEQKVNALLGRTKARDLYDVSFLVKNYRPEFTESALEKLRDATDDINALESRFRPAFEDDDLVDAADLTGILLSIKENLDFPGGADEKPA